MIFGETPRGGGHGDDTRRLVSARRSATSRCARAWRPAKSPKLYPWKPTCPEFRAGSLSGVTETVCRPQSRSVRWVRSIARPARRSSLKPAARKQAPWHCATVWSRHNPFRHPPTNQPPAGLCRYRLCLQSRTKSPEVGRHRTAIRDDIRGRLLLPPEPDRSRPRSGQSTPYGADCRRAAPIHCCRGPSARGAHPKLHNFVLSLIRY
jgi:hypothetical protein